MALMSRAQGSRSWHWKSAQEAPGKEAGPRSRFQVELLETRVLLFGSPLMGPFQIAPPAVLSPQAVVSYSAPFTPGSKSPGSRPSAGEPAIGQRRRMRRLASALQFLAPDFANSPFVLERASPVEFAGPRLFSAISENEGAYPIGASLLHIYRAARRHSGRGWRGIRDRFAA